jgi:perosamine synthetase
MSTLAIRGGSPVRTQPFPRSITTGEDEVAAAVRVLRTGLLSGFVGSPSPEFLGGPEVRSLEDAWSERFEVQHAVTCNSATSALLMAVGAAGVGPGDEVIVSPYTMSATATAVLFYGGIPVFSDIERDCYCLDAAKLESRITPRTKVILTTDIHGQSSDMDAILAIARRHKLLVITDTAQAPGATYHGHYAGTLGDIGVFSLNRHKNIQCGEGGVACTNDDELGLRLKLIRNHGENVVDKAGFQPKSLANMIGFNFRMTEVEAAIAHEQLKKMNPLNAHRAEIAAFFDARLSKIPFITVPARRSDCTHVYYMYNALFDERLAGVARTVFVDAIRAEGIPIWGGYLQPLYLEPLYQQRIAVGSRGFPFVGPHYTGTLDYTKGLCPVAEEYWEKRTITNPYLYPPLTLADAKDITDAFEKVNAGLGQLR